MKKLACLISLALLCLSVSAGTIVTTFTSTNNQAIVVQGPGTFSYVSIYNPTTNLAVVSLYDSPTNTTVWTNAAYTNFVQTQVTYTNIYTNIFGVITTNTYPAFTNAANAVAAATNSYRIVNTIVVPASSQVNSTLDGNVNNGIWATNTQSAAASNLVIVTQFSRTQ